MIDFDVAQCKINSHYGDFDFFSFKFGDHEDENVLVLKTNFEKNTPYVRVQSACFTAEIFRSKDCDCHEQLETSLEIVQKKGGMVIYLLQDGRGAGIFTKVQGMKLSQDKGVDTAIAYDTLGVNRDPRNYDKVVKVLKYFDVNSVKLLTNNPRKISGLTDNGINVERIPLEIKPTVDSEAYLKSKKKQLGHLFSKYI